MNKFVKHNLYNNFNHIVDYVSTHCDYFSLTSCGNPRKEDKTESSIEEIFSFYPNSLLKDDIINIEKGRTVLFLYFKFSPNSIKWLKLHKNLFDFDRNFFWRNTKTRIKTRYVLENVFFYAGGETVIYTDTFDRLAYFGDENKEFNDDIKAWAEKVTEEDNKPMNDFVNEWKRLSENGANLQEYIDAFKSEYYTIDLFLKVFDNNELYENGWMNAFKNIDMKQFAQVVVEKLKICGFSEKAYDIYKWFNFEKRYIANEYTFEREFRLYRNRLIRSGYYNQLMEGSEVIMQYLLTLPKNEFISSIKHAIFKVNEWKCSLTYLDTVFKLCDDYGCNINELGDRTVVRLKKVWDEIGYRNYEGQNVKRAILLNYFRVYVWSKLDKSFYYRLRRRRVLLNNSFDSFDDDDHDLNVSDAAENAILYFHGFLYRKDYFKAKENLEIAAQEPDFIDCQFDLARCYLNGWGTEKDIEQAKYWFTKAAENGHPKAQEQLDRINKELI